MRISRLILCISTHIGLLLSAVCPSCVVLGAFLCPTLPFPFCAEWAPDPCRVAGLSPFECSLSARSFSSLSGLSLSLFSFSFPYMSEVKYGLALYEKLIFFPTLTG